MVWKKRIAKITKNYTIHILNYESPSHYRELKTNSYTSGPSSQLKCIAILFVHEKMMPNDYVQVSAEKN